MRIVGMLAEIVVLISLALGTGCPRCQQLVENAEAAADQLGVMMTAPLAVDSRATVIGKVPNVDEMREFMI